MVVRRPLIQPADGDARELRDEESLSDHRPLVVIGGAIRQLSAAEDVAGYRPLVLIDGYVQELPAGDTLVGDATTGETTPDQITGLQAWWKADAITGLVDGAQVGEGAWPDAGPGGYNVQQYFGGFFPTYETVELNDLPVVRFRTGSQDKALRTTAPSPAGSATVVAAVRPTATSETARIWCGEGGSLNLRLSGDSVQWLRNGGGMFLEGATILAADHTYVIAATFTPNASATLYVNGVADGSTSHSATLAASSFTFLGASGLFGGESLYGDIAEVVVYDAVLLDSDRNAVTAYLAKKWGVTLA